MSSHGGRADMPARLREAGSELERELIAAAERDVPQAAAEERSLAAALAAQRTTLHVRRGSARSRGLVFAGVGAAALFGAGVSLWLSATHPVPLQVRPEPAARQEGPKPAAPREAVLPACPSVVRGASDRPLIDDFEDGNARLLVQDGRSGTWSTSGDQTGKQTPAAGGIAFPVLLKPARTGNRYALHLSTERLTGHGASLRGELAPRQCYDASRYAGIELVGRGSGRIYVGAMMIDVMETAWGGLCEKNCYDQHMAPVDLGPKWQRQRVLWKDFVQLGYGTPLAFNPSRLLSIDFSVLAADTPSDVWLDDIRFIALDREP